MHQIPADLKCQPLRLSSAYGLTGFQLWRGEAHDAGICVPKSPDGSKKAALTGDCQSQKKIEQNQAAKENDTPKGR